MASLKNSQTEKNIVTAFCGESQARNRYTYFASKAKRKAMFRFPTSLWKLLIRKKSTPNVYSNS